MKEAVMRLGPWHVERTLGRDQSGEYHVGRRGDGERAILFNPSGELASARDRPLRRLLELHRDLAHSGLVVFRSLEHDGGDPFLIADPVGDVMVSLRGRRRPAPGQTRAIGAALAAALAAAHERGVFHGGLELDNTLWAPGHGPQILGIGVAALGVSDPVALAHGDVVSLGRLLCALVASWARRGSGPDWIAAEAATVELVRTLADPAAAISMREAHALLAVGVSETARRHATGPAASGGRPISGDARDGLGVAPTEDHVPWGNTEEARTEVFRAEPSANGKAGIDASATDVLPAHVPRPERASGRLGRYRILTRLGSGGMGEVYLAEDPALRRGVAIKRIRPGLERDRTFRARLRREAQLAARLGHRAIVQVFDLITEDDVDHVVMEYVPGPSLHTLLASSPMAISEAVRIAAELADGLAYAHQLGIVHRDLKLENVLVTIDGQPKIADFGIARRTATAGEPDHESVTRDGFVVGTSRAMSPEQIHGQDVDARSDLFSFGVLLYELVTGTSPFAAGGNAMTILRVLNDRQRPAREVVAEVPRALSELIDHLLEKEPARRPDGARTVRDRLRRMLDGATEPRPRVVERPGTDRHPGSSMQLAADPAAAPADDLWLNGSVTPLGDRERPVVPALGMPSRRSAGGPLAAATGSGEHDRAMSRDQDMQRLLVSYRRDGQGEGQLAPLAGARAIGQYPSAPRKLTSRIQAPFVLAEIRALRASIFKRSPEIQSALAIADRVETSYDLQRADLFVPALETFCAILEPFAMTVLTGTLRRIGYEMFPQYVSILGIPAADVKAAMNLRHATDLVRLICEAYSKCVVGSDAGTLMPKVTGSRATVTDTTFMPCQLQMGVFLGAGKLTGLLRETALTETRCRVRGDSVCAYEFAL